MFLSCFLPACHQFFRPFFNTVFGFFFQSSDPFFHLWILFSMCWSRSLISENFYRDRVQQQKFDHFLLIFLALLLLFLIEILGKKLKGKKLEIYINIYIYIYVHLFASEGHIQSASAVTRIRIWYSNFAYGSSSPISLLQTHILFKTVLSSKSEHFMAMSEVMQSHTVCNIRAQFFKYCVCYSVQFK